MRAMRSSLASVLSMFSVLSVQVACGGGDDEPVVPDPVTLSFTAPVDGEVLTRDVIEPVDGWVAAPLAVQLAVSGEVATLEVSADERVLGTADATGALDSYLVDPGTTTLTATAKDAAGAVLATATIAVAVEDPELASCRDWLDHYGIAYTVGPSNQGVADPITVATPINGMPFRYLGNSAVRPRFFMDCSLARSLVRAAPHWRSRGIVEVQDIGVYNYRCIGSARRPTAPRASRSTPTPRPSTSRASSTPTAPRTPSRPTGSSIPTPAPAPPPPRTPRTPGCTRSSAPSRPTRSGTSC